MNRCAGPLYLRWLLSFTVPTFLALEVLAADAVETNQSAPATLESAAVAVPAGSNAVDQAQLTRQLIESLHKEIETQVALHTGAITSTLLQIEPALDRIRQQQAEAANSANRTILMAAGLFALAGFFGLGFLTMASVRAMGRFTEVAVNVATRKQLPGAGEMAAPSADSTFKPVVSATLEQASSRFQGALEQLERRILELEHSAHPTAIPAQPSAPTTKNTHVNGNAYTTPEATGTLDDLAIPSVPSPVAKGPTRAEIQLGKGQALLNLEQAVQALECFESALADEPTNTDALLRKGMTLEKLEQWDRALECYDRVIELDSSLTVAYLYKGGVCNRLEKHNEALQSYERALQSERDRAT
jgi:tetratricopeptide (TPR) repeat protein